MSGTADAPTESTMAAEQPTVRVGDYTWAEFLREHGHEQAADDLSRSDVGRSRGATTLFGRVLAGSGRDERARYSRVDWEGVDVDPAVYLGFEPTSLPDRFAAAAQTAAAVQAQYVEGLGAARVTKGRYGWEHFKLEYYYDEHGQCPRDEDGRIVPFDPAEYLGFDSAEFEGTVAAAAELGGHLRRTEARRTVNVDPAIDEDAFFSTAGGQTTVTNRYDLEKAVSMVDKAHFEEVERYWVDKPHSFVIVFHSVKENEKKYYLVSPYLNATEERLKEYLTSKLRTTIKYADDVVVQGTVQDRIDVIRREYQQLLNRYDLYEDAELPDQSLFGQVNQLLGRQTAPVRGDGGGELEGIAARPESVVLAEDAPTLTAYQVEKIQYLLLRDFIGFERIDGIKHDVNVEDISCDGYGSPVFVYHSEYEQLITNLSHGREDLDRFVVKLAQRSGKSISKRHPQVDATLPDGSRAQLTLGREVSDHGTNYTIRQFNEVPFTPVDLVNWHTFSLEEVVYLWLAIENNKSILFAGGTASGKTTSLNAMSLFVPSNSKIVSIEDTREVELPQRNWIASVTRPSFSADDDGGIDEFDLLEAALRQRPEYILMGEVRGEEGRTLFQVMSTGHTTLTTFHADTVAEVLKRFTTDPINVSKTMFTALDLVSVQTQTRVKGQKIRRNKVITEINRYDSDRDDINVRDLYRWQPESDEFASAQDSNLLEEIKFDRGWSTADLEEAMFKRRVALAYLIKHDLNEYAQVAATLQAFINDPDTILALMARGTLEARLEDLRGMESVMIDIDPEKERLVPRPQPDSRTMDVVDQTLEAAEEELFPEYRELTPSPLIDALPELESPAPIVAEPGSGAHLRERPAAEEANGAGTDDEQSADDDSAERTGATNDPEDVDVDGSGTHDGD